MYVWAETHGFIFVACNILRVSSVCGSSWSHICIGNHLLIPDRIVMKWILSVCIAFSVMLHWCMCWGTFHKWFLLVWCVGQNCQSPWCLIWVVWGKCLLPLVCPLVFFMLCSFHLMICFSLIPLKLHPSSSHIKSWGTNFLGLIWLGRHQFDLCTWDFHVMYLCIGLLSLLPLSLVMVVGAVGLHGLQSLVLFMHMSFSHFCWFQKMFIDSMFCQQQPCGKETFTNCCQPYWFYRVPCCHMVVHYDLVAVC